MEAAMFVKLLNNLRCVSGGLGALKKSSTWGTGLKKLNFSGSEHLSVKHDSFAQRF